MYIITDLVILITLKMETIRISLYLNVIYDKQLCFFRSMSLYTFKSSKNVANYKTRPI